MVGYFLQVRNTSLVYFRRPDDSNTVDLNVFNLLDTELKWKTLKCKSTFKFGLQVLEIIKTSVSYCDMLWYQDNNKLWSWCRNLSWLSCLVRVYVSFLLRNYDKIYVFFLLTQISEIRWFLQGLTQRSEIVSAWTRF